MEGHEANDSDAEGEAPPAGPGAKQEDQFHLARVPLPEGCFGPGPRWADSFSRCELCIALAFVVLSHGSPPMLLPSGL